MELVAINNGLTIWTSQLCHIIHVCKGVGINEERPTEITEQNKGYMIMVP